MRSTTTILVATLVVSLAPTQVGSNAVQEADDAYRMRDFDAAAEGYREAVRIEPKNGRAWYRLAYSEHMRERYAEAARGYEKCLELKYSIILSTYNLACAQARAGQKDRALATLEQAIRIGYTPQDQIQIDPDLESVRETPQFASLMRRAQQPVLYYSEGRRMANVAGTWSANGNGVMTANVTSKGHSVRIELVHEGRKELFLLLYFVAPDRWIVTGAAQGGSTFEGPVTFEGGEIVCSGKRAIEGKKEEARIRLALGTDHRGTLFHEVGAEGAWKSVGTYSLGPSN